MPRRRRPRKARSLSPQFSPRPWSAPFSGREGRRGAQCDVGHRTSASTHPVGWRAPPFGSRPRRPPTALRASTVFPDTLFGPLLADRTPGRDAGRDRGEKCGLARVSSAAPAPLRAAPPARLLVGLGNPGADAARHRHNVGFLALDALAAAHGFGSFKRRTRFHGEIAEGRVGDESVLALKPQTYMNESGRAVGAAMRFHRLANRRCRHRPARRGRSRRRQGAGQVRRRSRRPQRAQEHPRPYRRRIPGACASELATPAIATG